MNIIKFHFKKSKPVESWSQIEHQAKELAEFAQGEFPHEHSKCLALHHSQVSDEPFNFFVINRKIDNAEFQEFFKSECVINPEIVKVMSTMQWRPLEGCMSFPHRAAKKVDRHVALKVRYSTPSKNGKLDVIEREVVGIIAQIFQHEIDHANAINVFGFTE